jgi:hypothetical protein
MCLPFQSIKLESRVRIVPKLDDQDSTYVPNSIICFSKKLVCQHYANQVQEVDIFYSKCSIFDADEVTIDFKADHISKLTEKPNKICKLGELKIKNKIM